MISSLEILEEFMLVVSLASTSHVPGFVIIFSVAPVYLYVLVPSSSQLQLFSPSSLGLSPLLIFVLSQGCSMSFPVPALSSGGGG